MSDSDRPPVPSPCVRLCTLNDDDVCVGCGRTLDDIRAWKSMDDEGKTACVAQARQRLHALGRPVSTAPVEPVNPVFRRRG